MIKNNFFKAGKAASGRAKQAAVKHPLEGVIFSGQVRDVASNGQAVLEHSSGVAVFVRGAWVGEQITVKITSFKKRFATAVLVSVQTPSEHRITPACPYFMSQAKHQAPSCGGCAWQFIDYAAQLSQKQQWVAAAVARLKGKVQAQAVQTIVPSSQALGYRNRAEFKSDGQALGFNAAHSDALIDITACMLVNPAVAEHLHALRSQLPHPKWRSQKRKGKKTYTLLAVDDDMPSEAIKPDARRPFKQGNSQQNTTLKQWLKHALSHDHADHKAVELFAGSGNLTHVLAGLGYPSIIAAEVMPEAVAALNAQNLPGVSAEVADLFEPNALSAFCRKHRDAKTLVLDPPREGLVCIEPLLAHKGFERIAYISCDLATCMRDIQQFMAKGYHLHTITPVDLFPQTPHVELCVLLERAG